jgi:hypothetical protein
MVKTIPVLGTIVLIGAMVQVLIGFQVAADVASLRGIHMLFGVVGLGLVVALVAIALRSKTATIYSKITIVILTLVVLGQVYLGLQLLGGAETMVASHETTAFVVVLLSLLMGGITSWSTIHQKLMAN